MSLSLAMLAPTVGGANGAASAVTAPATSQATQKSSGTGDPDNDFATTLARMATDAFSTVKNGETTALAGMKGDASLQQVVQAVMQAEQTLQTVTAVRDKVVNAYLEISRMQI